MEEIATICVALGIVVKICDDKVMNILGDVGKRMSKYWNSTSIGG